jgi:predicted ester cyclase
MALDLRHASRRLIEEAFGKGNLTIYDEVCAMEYRTHDPLTGDTDRAGAKQNCAMYREAFPDLRPTFVAAYTDGEMCTTHWRMTGTHERVFMGLEPMGARCTVEGITIDRYWGGKIVESWSQWDALGLMRQLGVAPTVGAAAARAAVERRHRA